MSHPFVGTEAQTLLREKIITVSEGSRALLMLQGQLETKGSGSRVLPGHSDRAVSSGGGGRTTPESAYGKGRRWEQAVMWETGLIWADHW